MRKRTRQTAKLGLGALTASALLLCALASSALAASPLPASDYSVRAVCPAPMPGRASCLSLQLVPQTAEARTRIHRLAAGPANRADPTTEAGETLLPAELHSGYALPTDAPSEQTIALVDAYNDPEAESNLATYDTEFGLPACTVANKCFKQVNQRGEAGNFPFPRSVAELGAAKRGTLEQQEEAAEAEGWGVEISLDIQTAHAICQNCHIILVEADSPAYTDLEAAEKAAETLKANEISNSWGGPEEGETPSAESSSPFNDPGTVITASAGDNGYLDWDSQEPSGEAEFPSSSPHVVAVGGTRLELSAGKAWKNETVWNDGGESKGAPDGLGAGGGGCSDVFDAQPWQSGVADWTEVGCAEKRAVADVAADADPQTGVPVYAPSCQWCVYGGTSLASPIIAATYALAGGAHGVAYPAQTLYKNATGHPDSLHDVFSGSNGKCVKPFDGASGCTTGEEANKSCSLEAICLAHSGYDGPTGVGTPHGIDAFETSPASETAEEKAEHKTELEHQEGLEAEESAERAEEAKREEESKEAKNKEETTLREEAERREEREEEEIQRIFENEGGSYGGGETVRTHTATTTSATKPAATPAPPPFTPQLSALGLTVNALLALNSEHPRITQVSFAFTLNFPTQVKVTLAKRVRVHKHVRWQTTRNSFTVSAKVGRTSGHLGGHGKLSPGAYRLTATPAHAAAASISFQIG